MNKNDYEPIILAAKQEAIDRKQLPEGQVAIMAQGWLNRRRYLDKQKTTVEQAKKQVDERKEKIQKLMGDLNHAQALADHTKQEFWLKEVQKISEQLNKLKAGQ